MSTPLGPAPAAVPHDWPLRAHSHTLSAGGLRWHLQLPPGPAQAPVALLLHGTGASTHSLAALALQLAPTHQVLLPDLPGHAFTQRPASAAGLSLPGMAASLGALLQVLGRQPALIVGHSAGAAIAARMVLDGHAAPQAIVSLSGAWFPPGGAGAWWYAPAAKLLALNPLVPHLFAWQAARPRTLKKLLASTGSRIDAAGSARYAHLVSNPAHVGAVLAMMAAWELPPLLRDLPRLQTPLHLVAAERDTTVPPVQAQRLHGLLPLSHLHRLPGLGHLAHEEDPAGVASLIRSLLPD